jgi:hypothetical protein
MSSGVPSANLFVQPSLNSYEPHIANLGSMNHITSHASNNADGLAGSSGQDGDASAVKGSSSMTIAALLAATEESDLQMGTIAPDALRTMPTKPRTKTPRRKGEEGSKRRKTLDEVCRFSV